MTTKLQALSDEFYSSVLHQPVDMEIFAAKTTLPEVTPPPVHTPESGPEAMTKAEALEDVHSNVSFHALLPFVSPAYAISANADDYFFRPIPLFISDIPNRNGIGFPTAELVKWSVDAGCQAYMSWKGKPMHVEHADEKPHDAIGFIVDVRMVPLIGFGGNRLWKVIALGAMDRTKRTDITGPIEAGERNTYSMGCVAEGFTCSYCGAELGDCNHLDPKAKGVQFHELNGRLVYKLVRDITGKELSSVGDPAAAVCSSDFDHIVLK